MYDDGFRSTGFDLDCSQGLDAFWDNEFVRKHGPQHGKTYSISAMDRNSQTPGGPTIDDVQS